MKYVKISSVHIDASAYLDIDEMEMAIASVRTLITVRAIFSFIQYTDINECAESSTACDVNSRCEDRNGSYACCISTIASECVGKLVERKMKMNWRFFLTFRMWL